MTKIVKSDVNVQSIEQMMTLMESRLAHAWQALDGKPEAQAALAAAWEQVQQLGSVNNNLNALLQAAHAALDEAVHQRNLAIFDVKALEKHGLDLAQKRLAGLIAVASNIPLPDAERVLTVLMGAKTTADDAALHELLRAFTTLADSLYAEQIFNQYAASDEGES